MVAFAMFPHLDKNALSLTLGLILASLLAIPMHRNGIRFLICNLNESLYLEMSLSKRNTFHITILNNTILYLHIFTFLLPLLLTLVLPIPRYLLIVLPLFLLFPIIPHMFLHLSCLLLHTLQLLTTQTLHILHLYMFLHYLTLLLVLLNFENLHAFINPLHIFLILSITHQSGTTKSHIMIFLFHLSCILPLLLNGMNPVRIRRLLKTLIGSSLCNINSKP